MLRCTHDLRRCGHVDHRVLEDAALVLVEQHAIDGLVDALLAGVPSPEEQANLVEVQRVAFQSRGLVGLLMPELGPDLFGFRWLRGRAGGEDFPKTPR